MWMKNLPKKQVWEMLTIRQVWAVAIPNRMMLTVENLAQSQESSTQAWKLIDDEKFDQARQQMIGVFLPAPIAEARRRRFSPRNGIRKGNFVLCSRCYTVSITPANSPESAQTDAPPPTPVP